MTLKNRNIRSALNASLLLAVFVALFFKPISTLALGGNGDADTLRGVYASNMMALSIVQQPEGNAGYVSNYDGEVTQFRMASQFGNIGLLAHNYLSGRLFSQLTVGQEIRLVYGDGRIETFVVAEILRYQALRPADPYSSFRDLDKDETLSVEGMFKRVYTGDRHVTFQTCIEKDGELSWGRLFVIAVPKSEFAEPIRPHQVDR